MIVSSKEEVSAWVAKKLFARFNPDEAIGLQRNGDMVAGVVYENWNGASFVCHIAVQGLLTPSYLAAIFHYPFVHCGASKIIAPIAESNEDSIKFVSKLGFRFEHRLLDAHPDGSLLLYSMKPEHCRFIGQRYQQRLGASNGQRQPRTAAGT